MICIGKLYCSRDQTSLSIHLLMSTKRRLIVGQHSFELNFSNNNKANTGMYSDIARLHCNTNFEMAYNQHLFCMNHYMIRLHLFYIKYLICLNRKIIKSKAYHNKFHSSNLNLGQSKYTYWISTPYSCRIHIRSRSNRSHHMPISFLE